MQVPSAPGEDNFKAKIVERYRRRLYPRSIVYVSLFPDISAKLWTTFAKEEAAIKKKLFELREKHDFRPCDYGQDKRLAACEFRRSVAVLRTLGTVVAPFEIVTILQETHKTIAEEIEEFAKANGTDEIKMNGDIAIASLMTVFLNAMVEHPIFDMVYVQSFSYINHSITEIGNKPRDHKCVAYMVTNFVLVVENFKQIALNIPTPEKPKELSITDMIVKDFFVTRKKKAVNRAVQKQNRSVVTPRDKDRSTDGPETELSDHDTEESHGKIGKAPLYKQG